MIDEVFDQDAFLEEYKRLCQQYHVIVGGCGCCDSPFLCNLEGQVGGSYPYFIKHIEHLRETRDEN